MMVKMMVEQQKA